MQRRRTYIRVCEEFEIKEKPRLDRRYDRRTIATPINPNDTQELLKYSKLVIKMLYERDREKRKRGIESEMKRLVIFSGKELVGLGVWLGWKKKINLKQR